MARRPASPVRRQLLIAALMAGGGLVGGCAAGASWAATFFQPWKAHLRMRSEDWRKIVVDIRQLGFRQIYIQWLGWTHGADDWVLSDQTVQDLLDMAQQLGMTLVIGLPHDDRWQKLLGSDSLPDILRFCAQTVADAGALTQRVAWAGHPAFGGWYIPYEIEQYSWDSGRKVRLLADWLKALAAVLWRNSRMMPSISTYCSQLETSQTLAAVWDGIFQGGAQVRPLIQDGAGVYGQPDLDELDRLRLLLQSRKVEFDLIVELFQQQRPASLDAGDFSAVTAPPDRIRQQICRFEASGARRMIAFAAYPWLTDETEAARTLRAHWKALRCSYAV
ncbi:DUF4434 domain-containing protein [Castellaniella hirudinis]|uniref:DUF4434 domain-containing protein n=1 Tax=Castellaniella hirudinis TaxID=1144617 RepID=UPI0039C4B2DE